MSLSDDLYAYLRNAHKKLDELWDPRISRWLLWAMFRVQEPCNAKAEICWNIKPILSDRKGL